MDRRSRRIRQKNRPHNNIILPDHVSPQIIITTETDYTNHNRQRFVTVSYTHLTLPTIRCRRVDLGGGRRIKKKKKKKNKKTSKKGTKEKK
ncbi:hypothetical protein, partial [Escherichia coli]|uniref:hypothetical protein n=1 Tax=Escherichia coli TaxID=562 RepID=UPI001BC88F60